MWVAGFLSDLPSSFDGTQSQILGAKELPFLGEVFSHLSAKLLTSQLWMHLFWVFSPSMPYRLPGFGCGRPKRPSSDSPRDDHSIGRGACDSRAVVVVVGFALIATKTIALLIIVGISMTILLPIKPLFPRLML
ncbi:hypothetical protein Acr_22g0004920 [Actinidia rufa]|uniref:Uncharacterized protein n=1 Tax=Actinidia rufa TaxID=165716 RepID=A0A7J0GK45_9ERIC|nr:hypothetical protein Acr_22g0004920 [Actinidia rufa]